MYGSEGVRSNAREERKKKRNLPWISVFVVCCELEHCSNRTLNWRTPLTLVPPATSAGQLRTVGQLQGQIAIGIEAHDNSCLFQESALWLERVGSERCGLIPTYLGRALLWREKSTEWKKDCGAITRAHFQKHSQTHPHLYHTYACWYS